MTAVKRVLLVQTREIASISLINQMMASALSAAGVSVVCLYLETGNNCLAAEKTICLSLKKQDYAGRRKVAKRALIAFFSQNSFDYIFTGMYKPTELLASLSAHLNHAKCIGIFHAFGEFDRWSRRLAFRLKDKSRFRFAAVSAALRDYLVAQRVGITRNNCDVIHLGIDSAAFDETPLANLERRAQLSVPESALVIGTIGRLVEDKQHDVLIRAFANINRLDMVLVIIGDGEMRGQLERLAKDLKVSSRVIFAGTLACARRYLPAFDVFVFPSKQEGFGMALLEAMAAARPIIVNQIEPLKSILGDAGVCVDVNDQAALTRNLLQWLDLPKHQLAAIGEAARERARTQFSIEQFDSTIRNFVEL